MTEEHKTVAVGEADKMRGAARKMERLAVGIAVMIVALFISAGLVFYFAADITKSDGRNAVSADSNHITADNGARIVDDNGDALVDSPKLAQQRQSLIFTSITRFGTLLLIIYANSMLFNVFRYLIRAASYYRARAHALVLLPELTEKDADRFAVLAEAISIEKISFGKAPATPLEQVSDALSAAKKTGD